MALSSLVSAKSAASGNSEIVEAMLNSSSSISTHLETAVQSISPDKSGGYNVVASHRNGSLSETHFDAVVIACPLEFTNISFTGIPSVANITRRPFRSWYVTIVAAERLNPTYFGLDVNASVPDVIFTSSGASRNTNWSAIQVLAKAQLPEWNTTQNIYKIFANSNVTSSIPFLFINPVYDYTHHWPFTFPELIPIDNSSNLARFQPIILAPALYYLNSMESVASAMEGSVIAGRNAAMLVTQ